jgi:hypothetical protein
MKNKATSRTQKSQSGWVEIDALYHRLLHWFYGKHDGAKAREIADRLEVALGKVSEGKSSIKAAECRALIAEIRGDLDEAIKQREKEIRLTRRLHKISLDTPGRDYVLRRYDFSDLSDRLDLLAILYHDAGNLEKAIQVLRRSQRLCKAHGIAFDGANLLEEYTAARRSARKATAEIVSIPHRRGA